MSVNTSFTQLTDDHPVYKELKGLLEDGKNHCTQALCNPGLSSDERHFYSGALHNVTEIDLALEERRGLDNKN
tara:strand:- start:4310 stop:4528 length:219 start_codon:yes stop_codon:yes gene_type:complete